MPAPERTSLDAIVSTARELLETVGLAGLTMQAVAERVGVRAPSLYKRVDGRDGLIRLIAEATLEDLTIQLSGPTTLEDLADAFRRFGHTHPAAFQLVMAPDAGTPVARPEFGAAASKPILAAAEALAGEQHRLEAARTLTAWAAGFVSMELNGGFQLGGDVEAAWRFGVRTLGAALTAGTIDPDA